MVEKMAEILVGFDAYPVKEIILQMTKRRNIPVTITMVIDLERFFQKTVRIENTPTHVAKKRSNPLLVSLLCSIIDFLSFCH